MLLTVDHISVYYGAVQALRDVSFTVGKGEIVLEGNASDLREDPKVRAAYLGDAAG